jgi:membrane protein DedA with SNARE-associated domain
MLDRLLDWLSGLPTIPTYLVLMALSALENVFPPVPADTAVALGAFLARRGEVSTVLLGILCWAANVGSAAYMYFFARRHGPTFFRHGWGSKVMPPSVLTALEEAYAKYGVAGIFLSRFLPGLRAGVTPFAGIAGLPPARAIVPAAVASAVWYAFLVAAGTLLADSWETVTGVVNRANRALGFVALAATLLAAFWIVRRARRR